MNFNLKVLFVDANSGFYKIQRYKLGNFFGPVDLGLHLSAKYNSLNIGTGIFAGSIFPGSNRLIFTGFSPCWSGFYISSMGGAGLVFDDLGINLISIINSAQTPSILYLNRTHGEEIEVKLVPLNIKNVWKNGRGGFYSVLDYTHKNFGENYVNDPRILAVGPASLATDFGAIGSVPIKEGKISFVDTWAGRGGFGTKMLKEHGIASIIYGGTYIDEDFRNRKVADEWFQNKYDKKLAAKDFESTKKYRYNPDFSTGGTFGVNYTTLKGRIITFNYNSIYMDESERLDIHEKFIVNHYLKQFNEETIQKRQQKTCGEPCSAVCKKMNHKFKKDYEPYQTLGPLCGIFDQRAAEKLNHYGDMCGFDAISLGGVLSWFMECISKNHFTKEELGVTREPAFSPDGFNVVSDSMNNAELGIELIDSIIQKRGIVNLEEGARKFGRRQGRAKGKNLLNLFIYNAFGRKGWMVPNQYWNSGVLSPMPICGKYYMYYGKDYYTPRELGRKDAARLKSELTLDNIGMCRFHRKWAVEMMPEAIETLYGLKEKYMQTVSLTASRINSRNASIFWESERNMDYVFTFLERIHTVEGNNDPDLIKWLDFFKKDKKEASLSFWYDIHKGIHESLSEF